MPRIDSRRPVVAPAVCAVRTDNPQYRHPGDTVDGAPGGLACAGIRAARAATGTGRRPVGGAAPGAPVPEGRPGPAAPPTPAHCTPARKIHWRLVIRAPGQIPNSFRVGYAEYLRAATTSDLIVAALPGVAGIAGFTVVGAYVGYRQAKALQRALLAPVPTRFLL